jgi:hypothetical protein
VMSPCLPRREKFSKGVAQTVAQGRWFSAFLCDYVQRPRNRKVIIGNHLQLCADMCKS